MDALRKMIGSKNVRCCLAGDCKVRHCDNDDCRPEASDEHLCHECLEHRYVMRSLDSQNIGNVIEQSDLRRNLEVASRRDEAEKRRVKEVKSRNRAEAENDRGATFVGENTNENPLSTSFDGHPIDFPQRRIQGRRPRVHDVPDATSPPPRFDRLQPKQRVDDVPDARSFVQDRQRLRAQHQARLPQSTHHTTRGFDETDYGISIPRNTSFNLAPPVDPRMRATNSPVSHSPAGCHGAGFGRSPDNMNLPSQQVCPRVPPSIAIQPPADGRSSRASNRCSSIIGTSTGLALKDQSGRMQMIARRDDNEDYFDVVNKV